MNKPLLLLLAALLTCCGCASQYVMKLTNGQQIMTASKPKLKGAAYHYKDAKGRDISVPEGKVLQIEPASSVEEEKTQFLPPPNPKPKHWYFLWLA
jgi:hypothetical protein